MLRFCAYCLFAIFAELAPTINRAVSFCCWHLLLAIWRMPVLWPALGFFILILTVYVQTWLRYLFISPAQQITVIDEIEKTVPVEANQGKRVASIILHMLLIGGLEHWGGLGH